MENSGQFDRLNLMFQIPWNGYLSTVGHESVQTFAIEEHYMYIVYVV